MSLEIADIPLSAGGGRQTPDRVIVHAMAEYIDQPGRDYNAVDWLARLRLSAHAFVCPSGVVIRSRDATRVGWHAKGHNTNTLGVEFLVPGVHTAATFLDRIKTEYLTAIQYAAGVEYVRRWVAEWDINVMERHSDIDPERKQDPGAGFPWQQFVHDCGLEVIR